MMKRLLLVMLVKKNILRYQIIGSASCGRKNFGRQTLSFQSTFVSSIVIPVSTKYCLGKMSVGPMIAMLTKYFVSRMSVDQTLCQSKFCRPNDKSIAMSTKHYVSQMSVDQMIGSLLYQPNFASVKCLYTK